MDQTADSLMREPSQLGILGNAHLQQVKGPDHLGPTVLTRVAVPCALSASVNATYRTSRATSSRLLKLAATCGEFCVWRESKQFLQGEGEHPSVREFEQDLISVLNTCVVDSTSFIDGAGMNPLTQLLIRIVLSW